MDARKEGEPKGMLTKQRLWVTVIEAGISGMNFFKLVDKQLEMMDVVC
jgi:hypothetical protein